MQFAGYDPIEHERWMRGALALRDRAAVVVDDSALSALIADARSFVLNCPYVDVNGAVLGLIEMLQQRANSLTHSGAPRPE